MAFIRIMFCIALAFFALAAGKPSSDHDWVVQHMTMANHAFPPLPFNPHFPSYTQVPVFNPFLSFSGGEIEVPSPADIANRKADLDKDFSGAVLRRTSSNIRDEEGNKDNSGGSVFMSNHNGHVEMSKAGASPPDINEEFVFPSMPKFEPFKHFHFDHEPFVFEPIKPIVFDPIEPIVFDPIEPIDLSEIGEHSPGKGESYIGMGHRTSYSTKTVNGKTVHSSGEEEKIFNKDGEVMHEKKAYGEKDKPKH